MYAQIFATVIAILVATTQLWAGPLVAIDSAPMDLADAALVIKSSSGEETVYTPEQLENFQMYSLTTITPWRDEPAEFEGVLLTDLLAENGLSGANSIIISAENDYQTVITRELWEAVEILVATRVNGQPHTRRARGPIQFVIDYDAFVASDLTDDSNLVWMAARIEAND